MSNPYQQPTPVPVKPISPAGGANSVMAPLQDARFFISVIGWFNLIFGIIYALTIVGLIVAWLPIWIGVLLKKASEQLKLAQESGLPNHDYEAAKNLATVFKIVGVLTMIQLVITVLYLVIIIMVLLVGGFAAANAGN